MIQSPVEHRPFVVVVCGPSGAGKSSVARPLAAKLGLPLFSKDEIKEVLFDSLGWGNREISRALSDAAYGLMFHLLSGELAAGRGAMLEANFRPEAAKRLAAIARTTLCRTIQVRCTADPDVLMERLTRRAQQRLRHPGHLDSELLPEAATLVQSGFVDLPGPIVEVDSSGPKLMDVDLIEGQIQALMAPMKREKGS